jgi:HD-GYP domain-containing protein (c-di-GMP phosphodiesterase class II)
MGQPMEHVIRQTVIALRMGDLLGLGQEDRTVLYYSGLLAWVGCHTDAYEQAKWFGDDIDFKRRTMFVDEGIPAFARLMISRLGSGQSGTERLRTGLAFPLSGAKWLTHILEGHWRTTDLLAERLGLSDDVRQSLRESYERWDGKGPGGLTGDQIRLTSRVVYLADVMAAFERFAGREEAVRTAMRRSGTAFDPQLCELFCDNTRELLDGLDAQSHWAMVLDSEPGLKEIVDEGRLDDVLAAIGDFTDLKSPYFIGHSRAVAELAGVAARTLGLNPAETTAVRRAGLVHDFGRLGVSNAIWDKPGPLTASEMERVRFHPYLTERMLAFTPRLAELGVIAVQHHERLDGSGYPRGLAGNAISLQGRVIAAADAYATMIEQRPHRPAIDRKTAAAALRESARAGKLDAESVEAVLQADGHRTRTRRDLPAGLTSREVEVLRLLTLGLSNRAIAERLTISRKTAGSHIEHIYAKTGANNRATAGLFAMQHGLMSDHADLGRMPDERARTGS